MTRKQGSKEAGDHDEGPYRPGDEGLLFFLIIRLWRSFSLILSNMDISIGWSYGALPVKVVYLSSEAYLFFARLQPPVQTCSHRTSWLRYTLTLRYAGSSSVLMIAPPMLKLDVAPWLGHVLCGYCGATNGLALVFPALTVRQAKASRRATLLGERNSRTPSSFRCLARRSMQRGEEES